MMRSLFAGVSGLKNHQVRMDVIGNNVANVNTVGFKSSRVTFQESFAQQLAGANRPQGGRGGTNPMQVGLGMQVGSIDSIFSQGSFEATGRSLDLAIDGDAFFVVGQGEGQQFYTRAGNFQLDANGTLVTANGGRVQGRTASEGILGQTVGDITLPIDQQVPAKPTTEAKMAGSLSASAVVGKQVTTSIRVFDSQGGEHELKVVMEKTAANEWSWTVDEAALATGMTANPASGTLTFDAQGQLAAPATDPRITLSPPAAGQFDPIVFDLRLGGSAGLTQFAGASSAVLREQDGYMAGELQSFEIDAMGTVMGSFSNGTTQVLGQLAVAEFSNPSGLVKNGENLWAASANSGGAVVEFLSGDDGTSMASGMLEMSNVDLTTELTSMIITQRGFQANGRVITSADEMLQEIVNLKR